MSITTEVLVVRDTASPAIARLVERLSPQRLSAAVGPAAARCVQRHLRGLGHNKRGWPTTNFWAGAARATSWSEHPEGALVSVNQIGVRQRFRGGPIAPVNKGALAIPISPVSYGHVPADFPGLFLLKTKKGAYLCQYGDEAGGIGGTKKARMAHARGLKGNWKRRQEGTLNFLFKLSAGVNQAPNPEVLPTHEEVRAAAKAAVLMAARTDAPQEDFSI